MSQNLSAMVVALPMYLPSGNAVQAFWSALADLLEQRHGVVAPRALCWPGDLHNHWLQDDVLLSQTCGYPLSTVLRNKVQVVGTLGYQAPGAEGLLCRSQLIRRSTDARTVLADFANSTLAYNSRDSQSGYNALRALVASTGHHGPFFAAAQETGGHFASIEQVQSGAADMAAIDCVSLALWRAANPGQSGDITVFAQTRAYPGLPLISALSSPAPVVAGLRECLHTLATDDRYREVRAPLLINHFAPTTLEDYAVCLEMEQSGVPLH